MSEHPRDDELLKTFLSGDSELSRRYRESDAEEPPAPVDAAILASARWAVGADRRGADRKGADANAGAHGNASTDQNAGVDGKRHSGLGETTPRQVGSQLADSHLIGARRRHHFVARWRIPLATAAVVVVAATLTLMIERDPENDRINERYDSAPSRELALNEPGSAVREHAAETLEQAKMAAPATEAASAKPAEPAPASAPSQGVGNQSEKSDSAKAEVAKKNTVRQEPAKPAAPAPPATAISKQQDIIASKPGTASEEKHTLQAAVAPQAAEPMPQAQQVAPQSSSVQDDGDIASGRDTDAAVAGYTGAAFPDAGNLGATPGERHDEPSTLADVSTAAETKQTASVQAASEREQAFAGASDESVQPGSADLRDPGQWIRDINDLLAQGKRAQAIDSLKAFRRKYPDYRLTPELRALLPADAQ